MFDRFCCGGFNNVSFYVFILVEWCEGVGLWFWGVEVLSWGVVIFVLGVFDFGFDGWVVWMAMF